MTDPTPTRAEVETARDRFFSRVTVKGRDECWPWSGAASGRDGRGSFSINGKRRTAPSISLLLSGQDMPIGKTFACHTCDNPNCVNPNHLWWGDVKDNSLDASRKKRLFNQTKTHCPAGHLFSGDNLKVSKRGYRICAACQRESVERYDRKRREPSTPNRSHVAGVAWDAGCRKWKVRHRRQYFGMFPCITHAIAALRKGKAQ